jgi:minor extracellular serine protease Vpr
MDRDFSQAATVQLRNFSNSPATFAVADGADQGSPHTLSVSNPTVTVGPRSSRDVQVRLNVPLSTAGGGSLPGFTPFSDVSGLVTFTPVSGSNNGVTLRVPYYMVPQGISHVSTSFEVKKVLRTGSATATSTNKSAVDGSVDWYAWGISSKKDDGLAGSSADVRAVGVQADAAHDFLAFGVSTYKRWSNASQNEIDIYVDVNNDGTPDYLVVGGDLGALSTGTFDGRNVSAVFDLNEGGGVLDNVAIAPTDSTTSVLPIELSLLSDTHAATSLNGTTNKRFTYWVVMTDLTTGASDTTDKAVFNPFTPAVSNGTFAPVAANGSVSTPVSLNASELLLSPALGWMVISQENPSGNDEAQLIGLKGN